MFSAPTITCTRTSAVTTDDQRCVRGSGRLAAIRRLSRTAKTAEPTAITGCSTRARTRMWAVAEKSARKPSVSEADGKSVSPSAVTAPLMPTMTTATSASEPAGQQPALPAQAHQLAARCPPGGERERCEQQERVDQVQRHRERPADRVVLRRSARRAPATRRSAPRG